MIIIIIKDYKSKENEYVYGFVHRRVKGYQAKGEECIVFVPNRNREKIEYMYDGVKVIVDSPDMCAKRINLLDYKLIVVHFLNKNLIETLKQIKNAHNVFLYAHGTESLYWHERIFPKFWKTVTPNQYIKNCISNELHMKRAKKLIQKHPEYRFITVSEWMRNKAAKNWKVNKDKWYVIPNYVDNELFQYIQKEPEQRYNILTIRSFATYKYANDLMVELINRLQKYDWYEKLTITIVGDGCLYDSIIGKLNITENIYLVRKFINQEEIYNYHRNNGIFLCPTRQDAQGVSMCEAMSSGLVPITMNNTAIPEFVPDKRFLSNKVEEMENLIKEIIENERMFMELSRLSSEFINKKCGYNATVEKELELFLKQESDS